MGVPKFYRWISERYPNITRVISDNQIPEFDNFYLDMNGIIHACSHTNDENSDTNVSEEDIFRNIFHYIDFLFRMIKPRKVFFMAVDGVAPRAKMNQQRARRFRAGRDRMKKLNALAEKSGTPLNEMNRFDTNAITPGTEFMFNLNEQLKYFINIKITTDPLWEGVQIHLSGHLTPGEGEHKIMDFIRFTRSLPNYNANTRHCLYGLDADLIMLGLVTHELNFALLREEVTYGVKKTTKIPLPEEINWHLLHLNILREYIDLEFRPIKDQLKFPYDIDKIVDDWILMGYLVGNDFVPHLPHFHINENALPLLWDTYKKILPKLDGYMNDNGHMILSRFETYITELSKFDFERFEYQNDTIKHFDTLNSITFGKCVNENKMNNNNNNNDIQNMNELKKLITNKKSHSRLKDKSETNHVGDDPNGELIDEFIEKERKDAQTTETSEDINIKNNDMSIRSSLTDDENPVYPDPGDEHSSAYETLSSSDDSEQEEGMIEPSTISEDDNNEPLIESEFRQHKRHYYREKMNIEQMTSNIMRTNVEHYIFALQWILKYYYNGCQSWSWFYPQHYAPYLSDLKNFKDLDIQFDSGKPFRPFEQLLAVLPPTSRDLLPKSLQSLMTDIESPLLQFYPEDFRLDQNEKKQDWESIVLLPFIDEKLLLNTISKYYTRLTDDENLRNDNSPSYCYTSTNHLKPITNILKNPYFPPLTETKASCKEYAHDYYRPTDFKYKTGRFTDQPLLLFPKFPCLNVLDYEYSFKKSAVDIFESKSKSVTLVLRLKYRPAQDLITYNENYKSVDEGGESSDAPFIINDRQKLIQRYMGKCLFMNWPHFEYGVVCAISDFKQLYIWKTIPGGAVFSLQSPYTEDIKHYTQTPVYVTRLPFEYDEEKYFHEKISYTTHTLRGEDEKNEYSKATNINRRYEVRQGVNIGHIPLILYISPLIGYRTQCQSSTSDRCSTYKCFSNQAYPYPLQTCLFQLPNYKSEKDLFHFPQTINDNFKLNDLIFSLHSPSYACYGHVQNNVVDNCKHFIECKMNTDAPIHPDIHALSPKLKKYETIYYSAQEVAAYLQTHPCVISKITGTVIITSGKRDAVAKINVGLSWKMNNPVKQLHGYTKKIEGIWCYSDEAVLIIIDYMTKFPELVTHIIKYPKLDCYPELSIWPPKKGKTHALEIRTWIKSLPTYSMQLTSASWIILDTPVIKQIDSVVKSYYKRSNNRKTSSTGCLRIEASRLFKPCEYLGLCNADPQTEFCLYDRVVTVRLGAGVPIGSRGTVIGVMPGRTNLDTYFEILFDELPKGSLYSILFNGGQQQQCRVKVRSYHLLNYTHSLRFKPHDMMQRSTLLVENPWERRSLEPLMHRPSSQQHADTSMNSHPQSIRILKRGTGDNNGSVTTNNPNVVRNKSSFVEIDYQQSTAQNQTNTRTRVQQQPKSVTPSNIGNKSTFSDVHGKEQPKDEKIYYSPTLRSAIEKSKRPQDSQLQNYNSDNRTGVSSYNQSQKSEIPQQREQVASASITERLLKLFEEANITPRDSSVKQTPSEEKTMNVQQSHQQEMQETNVVSNDLNKIFMKSQLPESPVSSMSSVNHIDISQLPLPSQQINERPAPDVLTRGMNPNAQEFVDEYRPCASLACLSNDLCPIENTEDIVEKPLSSTLLTAISVFPSQLSDTQSPIKLNVEQQLTSKTKASPSNRKEITASKTSAFTPVRSGPSTTTTLTTMQPNIHDSMHTSSQQPSVFSYAIEQMCNSEKNDEHMLPKQTNDVGAQSHISPHQLYSEQHRQNTYPQNSVHSGLLPTYPMSVTSLNNNQFLQYHLNSSIGNTNSYPFQLPTNGVNYQHTESNGSINRLNRPLIEQQQNQSFPLNNDYNNPFSNPTTQIQMPSSLLSKAIRQSAQLEQITSQQQQQQQQRSSYSNNNNIPYSQQQQQHSSYSNNTVPYSQQPPQMTMISPFQNNVERIIPLPSYHQQPSLAGPTPIAPSTSVVKPSGSTLQFVPSQVLRNIPKKNQ
ncbi:unnamed protein product [Didymodactylos carnosus]|uniref:Uncharacterized protein n=1 Tax=Didymodactylos carnosus TaxID=1234261 RepID=A0A813WAL3_9BILA|nr:unnamed protein product [Didymodactylos carnosus]CAF0859880.1 unnamed protein product [Didymodactylos carnosus]CAF3642517.1 unnamed protein product [Didymodactylos carnosus]CAF3644729.1 unnamed protein product [Didymodactylos carnosus]